MYNMMLLFTIFLGLCAIFCCLDVCGTVRESKFNILNCVFAR